MINFIRKTHNKQYIGDLCMPRVFDVSCTPCRKSYATEDMLRKHVLEARLYVEFRSNAQDLPEAEAAARRQMQYFLYGDLIQGINRLTSLVYSGDSTELLKEIGRLRELMEGK